MSSILGAETLIARLKTFDQIAAEQVEKHMDGEMERFQRQLVDTVPVDSGEARSAIESPDLIRVRGRAGSKRWKLSLAATRDIARRTYYLFWVEFGTKGYVAGSRRRAGVTKRGRLKQKRVKRNIPPRPAQPFFRPALVAFLRRVSSRRQVAQIMAAAMTGAGLKGRER